MSSAVAGHHNATTTAAAVSTAITPAVVHIAVRVSSGSRRTDDDVGIGGTGMLAAGGPASSVMTFIVAEDRAVGEDLPSEQGEGGEDRFVKQ
ncbi:hypothetical protein [Amycolatopsis sp. BJA-103]|uniref:hypothetical protein n=1 Tax=Amycolatopsis sp. BJA-103 TaxID=1911175 RepID=UPI0011AF637E|nr:hypothetical protein [Amycolatopsis sp. BJA-103]